MTQPSVAALVVTYHTGPVLNMCLEALRQDTIVSSIILIDNGNPEEVRSALKETCSNDPRMTYLNPGENLGFGRAVNLAARQASADHFLIINPDAVLQTGAAQTLQETAQELTEPWILGGRIEDKKGDEQRGGRRRRLTLWRAMTSFMGLRTWNLNHLPSPNGPVLMPVISGAFFLTSKESFETLGGFDEAYFLHFEDVDLCARCTKAGGEIVYDPRARVIHAGASSEVSSRFVARHKARSLSLYFQRHGNLLERVGACLLMPVIGALIRARAH